MAERIHIATIAAAHGIRGELKLRLALDEDLEPLLPHLTTENDKPFPLKLRGTAGGLLIVASPTSPDRNAAEALKGTKLYIDKSHLPELEDDAFYVSDLIGMQAFSPEGKPLGHVHAAHHFGASDILEIRWQDEEGRTQSDMLTFTLANVPEVDVEARRIVVVWPEVLE